LAVSLRLLDSSPFGPLPFRRRSRRLNAIRVHPRSSASKGSFRAAHRARHSRAPILPPDPPIISQERFSPARATFFAPRRAAAHRDTPPSPRPSQPPSCPSWRERPAHRESALQFRIH
jgi:hypothetical protein